MKPSIRHISYRRLGTSEVHHRYLEDDPELAKILGRRPRDAGELLKRAPLNARRLVDPKTLSKALLAYAERHDAPGPVLENAREVAEGKIAMVVTGQQPGLLGGPLYTLHKAATAIRLARDLSAQPGAPKVLPIFWNHTDDHDLDEVNRAFLVNSNQDLQRLRLDLSHSGEAVRNIGVGRAMEHVLGAARDLLPRSEFRDSAFEIFEPRHNDEQFGDSLARLLFSMFGKHGLLVIEPRDLPASAFEVLPRWREMSNIIRERVSSVSEHLGDLGFDVTLDPGTTMMFQMTANRRVSLADVDEVSDPMDLSPGVLLRPMWQDACLPTIGFVVGPGELSYLAVTCPLYKTLGVPKPVLVPRASLTLVEPSMTKLLKRFGWDITDLASGSEVLALSLDDEGEDGVEAGLEEITDHLRTRVSELGEQLRERDPQMLGALQRAGKKAEDELQKVRQKLRNSRQNRQGTGLRQIRRLCNNLRPRSRLQERVLNVLPFLVSHGVDIADHLIEAADPFATNHGVLDL
ncbi:MAG: bacillithiol biosynthesis protein BshC [Planctomycetota bacterium]